MSDFGYYPTRHGTKSMNIVRDFIKAIYDFSLISPGDRILLGISGGKDSLALGSLETKRRMLRALWTPEEKRAP